MFGCCNRRSEEEELRGGKVPIPLSAAVLAFVGLLDIARCHGWIRRDILARTLPGRGPGSCSTVPFRPPRNVFEEKRTAVVEAFRALCRQDLKELFLAPLLTSMGVKELYFDEVELAEISGLPRGCMKIDVACVDCAQGARYRRSIVEYLGTENLQSLLEKVEDVVGQLDGDDIERVQDVFRFADVVKDAQRYASSAEAWKPVLENPPFANFFELVYPRYLDAMASEGYFLSDLELMLLCECAKRNGVIVQRVQSPNHFHRAVFKVHEWVMAAGNAQEITVVAIGGADGAAAVRGHYERLECVTRELPPPIDAGASSEKQASTGRKRGSPDTADGMNVDGTQSDESVGQKRGPFDEAAGMDVDEKQAGGGRSGLGGDGRSGMGDNAEQNMHQAKEDRGSWAGNSSDVCCGLSFSRGFDGGLYYRLGHLRHVVGMPQVVPNKYH